ncbi:TPA: cobalamin biosynthesis protein CbiX, partial [Escherichia coli]
MKNIMTSMSHGTGFLLFHKKTEKGNRFSFIQGPDGQEIKMKSCFDTDKDFQMSSDEVTFNADSVRSKLELLSEALMHRCGLVYELYQRRLSAAIDNFVSTLPTEQHL